jgi:seryl-tRNA synthetase
MIQRYLQNKGKNIDVDAILAKDDQRKDLQKQIDDLKFQQRKFGEEKKYEEAKALKTEIQAKEESYQQLLMI